MSAGQPRKLGKPRTWRDVGARRLERNAAAKSTRQAPKQPNNKSRKNQAPKKTPVQEPSHPANKQPTLRLKPTWTKRRPSRQATNLPTAAKKPQATSKQTTNRPFDAFKLTGTQATTEQPTARTKPPSKQAADTSTQANMDQATTKQASNSQQPPPEPSEQGTATQGETAAAAEEASSHRPDRNGHTRMGDPSQNQPQGVHTQTEHQAGSSTHPDSRPQQAAGGDSTQTGTGAADPGKQQETYHQQQRPTGGQTTTQQRPGGPKQAMDGDKGVASSSSRSGAGRGPVTTRGGKGGTHAAAPLP